MKLYDRLSKVPFLKTYSLKFLFVAFVGIHIPLIGVSFFFISQGKDTYSWGLIFVITLVLTLTATAATLYALNQLLIPLRKMQNAMRTYDKNGSLPKLPMGYNDEAGELMRRVQNSVTKLDHNLKSREEIISMLSHDFRAPLGNLVGLTGIISDEIESPELKKHLNQVKESAEEQLNSLDGILSLLRNDTFGFSESMKTKMKLIDVVQRGVSPVTDIASEKEISLHLEIAPSMEVKVVPELFQRAVQNLVSNAIKFSIRGGSIDLIGHEGEDYVSFAVRDHGLGFSGDGKQFFKKFTKAGRTGTEGEKSTGLGLYITQKVVDQHGGRIYAHSGGMGKGATFTIEIPN